MFVNVIDLFTFCIASKVLFLCVCVFVECALLLVLNICRNKSKMQHVSGTDLFYNDFVVRPFCITHGPIVTR